MEISVENIIFLIPIYYVFKFDAKRGALFLNSEVRIEKKHVKYSPEAKGMRNTHNEV